MLLRLLSGLLGRKQGEPPGGDHVETGRGTAVAGDGSARPAVRLRIDAQSADASNIAVEAHPELRSAALLHTHYLPDVTPAAMFEMHRRYGGLYLDEVPAAERVLHRVTPDTHRRIRIGYVSPNLSSHSVAYLIEPVLAHHDRSTFEIYAYHTAARCDETTGRIRAMVDAWRQVDALSDLELARCIAEDRIDVLVDLAGHTLGGRLGVFARRPAPVQITWLGYPDTTGLPTMDYRITDAVADPPPHADARHTERLLRLPGSFLCYRPPAEAPDVVQRAGETEEVVFCSFNTLEKVNAKTIALWSGVLRALPRSRLLLKAGLLAEAAVAARIRGAFSEHGIDEGRLELIGWAAQPGDHLSTYGRADIALDTWPYNGTITTCEAMWMGVPVVTLAGEAHMSRVGATLLTAIGMPELIAHTPQRFVEIATALARDVARRRALRASLRPRIERSALLDHAAFTRRLEDAMRAAWLDGCATASG